MKPFKQYGTATRRMLKHLRSKHPQPVRVAYSDRDFYQKLEQDGWVKPIGSGSVMLTDKGAGKLSALEKL